MFSGKTTVGIGQCRLFVDLCKKWVSLCGCVCVCACVLVCLCVPCVDVFVYMLVGNIATSCVSGDTQDAELKTTRDLRQIFGELI